MGLDQYLYRTTRENFDRIKAVKDAQSRYYDRVAEIHSAKYRPELSSLPRDASGGLEFSRMRAGQKAGFDAFVDSIGEDSRRIAEGLGFEWKDGGVVWPELENGDEIGHWRNDWDLHIMIVDRFWDDGKGDNCVRIPLDERSILQILEWEEREGDTFRDELALFSDALDAVRSGLAVYYMPWY